MNLKFRKSQRLLTSSPTIVLALLVAGSVFAQPMPKVNSISQEYVQRGSSVKLTFNGENVGEGNILVSGEAGLKVTVARAKGATVGVEASGGGVSTIAVGEPNRLVATVEVETNAPLGRRELRVATKAGVSNPMNFVVSHLPEVKGASGANSIEKAQVISLPVAVTANLGAAAESDFYRFAMKKGQRVILEVVAQRLGSAMDSSLAVLDKDGKELARNEDAVGNDSVLEFVAPEEGEYLAQVRDYRMQGGGNFKYRLLISEGPFVLGTFPLGGKRGEIVDLELRGLNLGSEKMRLKIEADAKVGQQDLRSVAEGKLSNPFPFVISDLPQVMEAEPNTSVTHANVVSLPAAINGRIQSAKDYDAFRFHVEKDQRFVFEVMAQRFGSPLDALLTLTDVNGNVLQRNDDANGPDARIDQTFGAAGDYYLFVEDLLERGGSEYTYRIECTRPVADFEVKFVSDSVRLPRGGRAALRVELTRSNGFNEPVRVEALGMQAEPLVVLPGESAGLIFLSAAQEATLGDTKLQIYASAMVDGKIVTKDAKAFAGDKAVKEGFVTIVDDAPFLIDAGQLMAAVEQEQTVDLVALLERRDGFSGDVKISLEGFSAGRDPVTKSFDYQPVTLKGKERRGVLKVKGRLDSEIGTRMMVFKAEGGGSVQYSAPFPVATSQVPFVLTPGLKRIVLTALPAGSQSAAGEAVVPVKVERRAGFDGEIILQLEGAPSGVTVTAEKFAAGAKESSFKVVASEICETGKEVKLTLTGTGVFKDRTYRFKPAEIALIVNAPEAVEVKAVVAGGVQ
jgi:hypothetical protein